MIDNQDSQLNIRINADETIAHKANNTNTQDEVDES